jgi:hypothetical protein
MAQFNASTFCLRWEQISLNLMTMFASLWWSSAFVFRLPVHFAAISGCVPIFLTLIAAKISLEATDGRFFVLHWTPLHFAADAGKLEIVKLLVAQRVKVNELTKAV